MASCYRRVLRDVLFGQINDPKNIGMMLYVYSRSLSHSDIKPHFFRIIFSLAEKGQQL